MLSRLMPRLFLVGSLLFVWGQALSQTCNNSMVSNHSNNRYQNNGDTVTDLQTGLMWQKCTIGLSGTDCSIGNTITFTWDAALQKADSLNVNGGFSGYTDWRLPNIKELESLVDLTCSQPSINTSYFPNTVGNTIFVNGMPVVAGYWTASPSVKSDGQAWIVNFYEGFSYDLSRYFGALYVRLVRGG